MLCSKFLEEILAVRDLFIQVQRKRSPSSRYSRHKDASFPFHRHLFFLCHLGTSCRLRNIVHMLLSAEGCSKFLSLHNIIMSRSPHIVGTIRTVFFTQSESESQTTISQDLPGSKLRQCSMCGAGQWACILVRRCSGRLQ